MPSTIIMAQYPLTREIRHEIELHSVGGIQYLVVSNIVHTGYFGLIRQLRAMRCDRLIIQFEDLQNKSMGPIYRIIALLISATERYTFVRNGKIRHLRAFSIFGDLFFILVGLMRGLFVAAYAGLYFLAINKRGLISVRFTDVEDAKRVLYLRSTLWLGLKSGGAVSHGRGVIEGLIENGYQVDCISDDILIDLPKEQGEVHVVNPTSAYIVPRELNNFNYQHPIISFLKRRFGKLYSGIIYQRIPIAGFAGVVMSRFWRVPLVVEYNGSEMWLLKNWGSPLFFEDFVSFIELSVLKHAYLVVTVSEVLQRELISRGIDNARIAVCANGVDVTRFMPGVISSDARADLKHKFGFEPDDIVFTFVGSFGAWHGAGLIADTINSLIDEPESSISAKCKFLMIGSGVEFSSVQMSLQDAIDQDRVVMIGLVDQNEVPVFLEISDVCLVPTLANKEGSEFFGSPTKLFEYMAAGKPVIASAVGQVKDIMKTSLQAAQLLDGSLNESLSVADVNEAIGVAIAVGDVKQLKTAILCLAASKDARLAMGKNGRRAAKQKHTWKQHVSRFIDVFDNIIAIERARPLRILLNVLHAKSGGGVTYLQNMLPILGHLPGLEVHVFLDRSQVGLFDTQLNDVSEHFVDTFAGLSGIIFAEQFLLPRIARRLSCDVVFSTANYGPLNISNGVILLRNSLDVATVERRFSKLIYWGLIYAATMVSLLTARRVIAVSNYACNTSTRGVFERVRKKVSIVPHGISSAYSKIERKPSLKPFVLTVSDIYVQKNLHTLIEGFAVLLKDMPELTLKIAGKKLDANYYALVCRIVEKAKITHAVKFLGHVSGEDLLALYANCTVFVFPSTVETFGNPLVEAMASGCPIICTNTAAMPEIAGDAVRYVDPTKSSDFTDALHEMINDETIRDVFSARARSRSKLYSWDQTAHLTVGVLRDVAKKI